MLAKPFAGIVTCMLIIRLIVSCMGSKLDVKGANVTCIWRKNRSYNTKQGLKAYWINLDERVQRRKLMENQLRDVGLKHKRISAITPSSPRFNITVLEKPCKRNTNKDLAVILSHMTSIREAIYDLDGDANYALILEDDVRFSFDINFEKLIASAPSNFGVLQLMTSNVEAIHKLWMKYIAYEDADLKNVSRFWTPNLWDTLTRDKRTVLFWSAQAYIINKKVLRPFVDDVVQEYGSVKSLLSFRIINSFDPRTCIRTKQRPCILANCLFADSYIYAGANPAYVLNIPLFNGDALGYDSSIHQDQVVGHKDAFSKIQHVINKLKSGTIGIPDFISIPECLVN